MSLSESIAPYVKAVVNQIATWGVTLYGVINLNKIAVMAGLVLTCMQIYALWKREYRKPKD